MVWLGSNWFGGKWKWGLDGWVGSWCAESCRFKTGARLWGEQFPEGNELGREVASFEVDGEAGIEGLVDGDSSLGITEAVGAGQYLKDDLSQSDGVVVGDNTVVLEAEDGVEFGSMSTRAVSRIGALRDHRKAAIEATEESREEGVALGNGADVGQLQLLDKSILEGAPKAFDSALGLRGVRSDESDTQLGHGSTELGG